MEPLTDLGRALARLRTLYGLSIGECAARIGVTVEQLAAIESGQIDLTGLEGIARLYDLDEDGLREGMIRPVEGVAGATIFLLQGAYQDFDARALDVLDRAMCMARAMTALNAASDEGRERLRRRLQFVPTAPAGPNPADAARQGYKLARMVRARMKLGGEPIEDIRALLEDQLGIAVVVDDLIGLDLRAASVLDVHRAAATAVLASRDPDRQNNPVLTRVYLAHELCHILFDPGSPGSVRIALDGSAKDGRASSEVKANRARLTESRAKGFAAELLIPLAGVSLLLGAPAKAPVPSLERARDMVLRVREHFGTSWEIAARHLENLSFFQEEIARVLLDDTQRPPPARHSTSLPAAAAIPVLLAQMLTTGEVSDETTMFQDPLRHVREARHAAEAAIDAGNAEAIAAASDAVERGRELEAAHLLVEHFDDLFHAGEFAAARSALARLDPHRFPRRVLTGVLMVTRHAREQLGNARVDFLARVQSALADTWRISSEDIAEIVGRLG
jgi:transcriptional regulator with XRE-family HTH domain/uncharacterized protein (DUF2267 family)